MDKKKKIIILMGINQFFEPLPYLDDEDEDIVIKSVSPSHNKKIEGYVERIIPSFNNEYFKSHFRYYYYILFYVYVCEILNF